MPLVLDASTALSWVLTGQSTKQADAILVAVMKSYAVSPMIWHFEVAAVLARDLKAGTIDTLAVDEFLMLLAGLDIQLSLHPAPIEDLLQLAKTFNISGYDAAYLALARDSKLPLATSDIGLARAATQCGVSLLRF